ncbi:protein kinase domain-containing protein [Ornithinicoccus halotolerans]|uniref:protein kinase domain-containing protein n=1 Tax=Ornithinicoccus halotolerans TaxID=1748220 RepID=UPI0012967D38
MTDATSWGRALEGQRAGDYELVGLLGTGRFGWVFEAHHLETKHRAAIKVLIPNADSSARAEFANEAALLRRLVGSSSVVQVTSSDHFQFAVTAGGQSLPLRVDFHVLELAQGCLESLLLEGSRIEWADRLSLWRGCVRGIHQMHLKRTAHRDLKSSNCLLFERRHNVVESKVSDLGRGRDLRAGPMHPPELYLVGLGDLRFAPPEFIACQGSDRPEGHLAADLYGLGSLLFELATGQCITAMALGPGPQLVRENLELRAKGQTIELSGMRGEYESAFKVFERSLPPVIRQHGGQLLRQLCDPVPSRRLEKTKFGRYPSGTGLEWLIRRADIVIRTLASQAREAERIALKKGA